MPQTAERDTRAIAQARPPKNLTNLTKIVEAIIDPTATVIAKSKLEILEKLLLPNILV